MTTRDAEFGCPASGTLLWIGPKQTPELQPIFDDCVQHTAQVAWRQSVEEAWRRPADRVRTLILATTDRATTDPQDVERLTSRHRPVQAIQLVGPLGIGDRGNPLALPKVFWHQWNQWSATLLQPCGLTAPSVQSTISAESVAVVTDTACAAEPLLDVASSCAVAVIWCRRPTLFAARNFDVVWWDDTVARPTSADRWRQRIASMQSSQKQTHVWLTTMPQTESVKAAHAAGVDVVLSKPARMDSLLQTLAGGKRSDVAAQADSKRAA